MLVCPQCEQPALRQHSEVNGESSQSVLNCSKCGFETVFQKGMLICPLCQSPNVEVYHHETGNQLLTCSNCFANMPTDGLKLNLDSVLNAEPEAKSEPKEKPIQEVLEVELDEGELKLPLPPDISFRTQNPSCNEKGHYCAMRRTQEICLKPIMEENPKDKTYELWEISACRKAKSDKIFVSD